MNTHLAAVRIVSRFAMWAGLLSLTAALAACGGGPPVTPDATGTSAAAATSLASLPTAAALNPTPTRTPAPTNTPVPPTATPGPTPTDFAYLEYTVQAGDTLLSVALDHKVSMAAIQLTNNLGDAQIVQLGQVLKIPRVHIWPDENVFWALYIVQPGDTLSTIGQKFGVTQDALVRANQLSDASAIRIGQQLIIPANAPVTPPEPKQSPSGEGDAEEVAQAEPVQPTDPPPASEPTAEPTTAPEPAAGNVSAAAKAAAGAIFVSPDAETVRAQMLALYNQARAAAGLPALAWSGELQQSAQLHASDCAQRGSCSHVGSDGADTRTRMAREGYNGSVFGENWAWGQTADGVFDAWFNQEYPDGPHRRNILSPRYAEVGFGVAPAAGGFYVVADFGSR